jgi:hypothetical protein
MSFVVAAPDMLATAATDVARIGETIDAAHAAAAARTTTVVAAAADEVSVAIAALFGEHARSYRAFGARAAALHEQFVRALTEACSSYVGTESANAAWLLGGLGNAGVTTTAAYAGTGSTWLDVATGTVTNLTSLTQFVFADPAPILHQVITNQVGYLRTLGAAFAGLAAASAHELGQLPTTLRITIHQLASGDVAGGLGALSGYVSAFGDNVAAASRGTLLPALAIPSEIATHLGNLASANTLVELSTLLSDVAYYPLNATGAASVATLHNVLSAAHTGDVVTALSDLARSPATITNAFLNGFPDPAGGTRNGPDPAISLLTNPTTGPDFGSVYNALSARGVVAGALGARTRLDA